MKVYLASRYSRRFELQCYADELRVLGHEVTSRWISGQHELSDREDYTTEYEESERQRFAQEDWDDLYEADVVLNFTEPPRSGHSRGGRHVEFGGALMAGKPVVVIGFRENVFHCLPQVHFYETWNAFLESAFFEEVASPDFG